jgi:hypothetical protein
MPQLAVRERIKPVKEKGVEVGPTFADDKSPAAFSRRLGKGRVVYVAALPGLAYLWSGLQPPVVPDRGPATHTVPTRWDKNVAVLLQRAVLQPAGVRPLIVTKPGLIDARLLKAPKGHVLPLANYNAEVGQRVTVTVQVGAPVKKATSAYHGDLPVKNEGGRVTVTIPALGYGDVLRLVP